jgi:PKD repeat protein
MLIINTSFALLSLRGLISSHKILPMKKILLLVTLVVASLNWAHAQYCIPTSTNGTSDGDFINGVQIGSINNQNTGGVGLPDYNNYTALSTTAQQGSLQVITVESGTFVSTINGTRFAVWIDYNQNNIFEVSEKIGEQQANSGFPNEIMIFNINIPVSATTGSTRMRIRAAWDVSLTGPNMDPCADYGYGETEDYTIVITSSGGGGGGYCTPSFTTGAGSGDYINSVSLGTLNNVSGASTAPFYTYFSALPAPSLLVGSSHTLTIQTGSYTGTNVQAAWIDWNNDGDFADAGEKLGETNSNGAFVNMTINFTVPMGTSTGTKRMRVMNSFSVTNLDPCGAYTWGEAEDYNVNITSSSGGGGYCIPVYTTGTADGDYIEAVSLGSLNNVSGASSAPFYTYYSALPAPSLQTNSNYTINITSGSYQPTYYAAWIDFNQDNDFDDAGEKLGEFVTNASFQTQGITFTVPGAALTGTTRLRIRGTYGVANMDPCLTYIYGETEDYNVTITQGGGGSGYCIPNYTLGTNDGDFVNGVAIGSINNQNTGSAGGPSYQNYTTQSTSVQQGSAQTIVVQGGTVASTTEGTRYAVWADWNQNNTFEPSEKLGEQQANSGLAFENLNFNFTVPAGAALGNTRFRVRAAYDLSLTGSNMDPCLTYNWGETEDYTFNVTTGGGGNPNYCVTLHSLNCSPSDAIDDVVILNSTLFNLTTGCNGITGPGYTLWPATGSTTTTLIRNQSYFVGVGTTSQSIISVWFDWNQDGTFSAAEHYQVITSSTPGTIHYISVTVPNGAATGNTRMRVRSRLSGNPNGPNDACTLFFSGETEDYTINITSATGLPPVALFSAANGTAGIDFFDLSANFPTSWSWSFPGGTPSSSNLENPTGIQYNTPGCYNVSLTVTNAFGSDTYTIVCFISVPETQGCAKVLISEYVEGSGDNKALELYNAGNATANLSQYSVETYSNGSTTATFTLNLSGTLAPNGTYVITNSAATNAVLINASNITSNITQFNGNDAVVLKNNGVIIDKIGEIGQDPGTAWPVGSGSTADFTLVRKQSIDRPHTFWNTTQTQWDVYPQNTFSFLGNHTSVCGGSSGQAPVANFTANVFNIVAGQSVNFTDLSTNSPTGWNWQFAGGFPGNSTQQNPQNIIYLTPGCYAVTLTASNAFGSNTASQTCYINVTAGGLPPVADFTANLLNVPVGQAVNFTDLSLNTPTSWSWQFQGGTPATSTLQNPQNVTFNAPGCYQVSLLVANAFGNDSEVRNCYINVVAGGAGAPVANFTANTSSICAGSCISFTDLSLNNPTAWSWSFPGATPSTSSSQNPTNICYSTPGTYSVTLTAINSNGSNNITQTNYITVFAEPVASAGNNITVCTGSSAQLNATGGTTYSWSPTTGLSNPNVANPFVSPTATTTYTVTVSNGPCSSIATVTVSVSSITANAGNDASICLGSSTQLQASGGVTYSWSPTTGLSNPSSANPTAFPTQTTVYTVTATDGVCTASDQVIVTVNALPQTPVISQPGFDLESTSAVSYQWSLNGVQLPGATFQTLFPAQTGDYTVTIFDANGCSATSAPFTVTLVGVNEQLSDNEVVVYPNPANKLLFVTLPAGYERAEISVTNALGQVVMEIPATFQTNEKQIINLNVDELARGVYFLRVQSSNAQEIKRFVKN